MNINALMQQAQKMQKDMQKTQEEVSKMTFTSKKELVEVVVKGDRKVVSIKINPEISSEDVEMLEDMITIATNEALKQAENEMEKRLSKYSSLMPGLF